MVHMTDLCGLASTFLMRTVLTRANSRRDCYSTGNLGERMRKGVAKPGMGLFVRRDYCALSLCRDTARRETPYDILYRVNIPFR